MWKQPAGAQRAVAGTAAVTSPQQSDEPVQQSLGRKYPMSSKVPARRSLLHRYSWLIVLLAMVAMAPIGWSIFWYAKSRAAAAAVTEWMAREAHAGRNWSCPSQTISGFPYTIVIACENMAFQGEVLGQNVSGTLHGLRATSPLLRSDNVLVRLEPPFAAKTGSGNLDLSVQWSELLVEFEGTPSAIGQIALMGGEVKFSGEAFGIAATGSTFGDVNGLFARSPGRQDQAYDVIVSFHQAEIPALNSFLDTNAPIAMQFEATMTPGVPSGAASFADRLEKWRAANGKLDVTFASLTSGPVDFNAKGGLGLDSEHRIAGKLDGHFAGLEKAFRNLNLAPAIPNLGQAVSGFLGGGKDGLKLPVIFSGGFLQIGPVRTGIAIPPLY
jgi:hypothetical protein